MAANRSEPFLRALATLRVRLTEGVYPAEAHLGAAELAADLGLSPTPVREALARLAGEGLLDDRRGQGFFLRRLSARDIADLYRLSQIHLQAALQAPQAASGPREVSILPPAPLDDPSAIRVADQLLAAWVTEAGGAVLVRSYMRLQLQLARVRRREDRFLRDLIAEYGELAAVNGASRADRITKTRGFFQRRVRIAARLAESLEHGP